MSVVDINNILGYQEKERELAFLLGEVLKQYSNQHVMFNDDMANVLADPDAFYLLISHIDKTNLQVHEHVRYITGQIKALNISEDPTIPDGYIGKTKLIRENLKEAITTFMTVFKSKDAKILYDLGLKLQNAKLKGGKIQPEDDDIL